MIQNVTSTTQLVFLGQQPAQPATLSTQVGGQNWQPL